MSKQRFLALFLGLVITGIVGLPQGALADPASFLTPGNVDIHFTNLENFPQAVDDTGEGIFNINLISRGATPLWATAISDGTQLTGFFNGLVVTSLVFGGGGTADAEESGGMLVIYNPAGTANFNPTGPPVTLAQICAGACPAPWLTADFHPGILGTLPATTVTTHFASFGTGQGDAQGYLDVTGGTAAALFDTNSLTDGADLHFLSDLCQLGTSGCAFPSAGTWVLKSNDPVEGLVANVPEPASLLLLGSGLVGLGVWRRVSRKPQ